MSGKRKKYSANKQSFKRGGYQLERQRPSHQGGYGHVASYSLSAKTDVRIFSRKTDKDLSQDLMRLLHKAAG